MFRNSAVSKHRKTRILLATVTAGAIAIGGISAASAHEGNGKSGRSDTAVVKKHDGAGHKARALGTSDEMKALKELRAQHRATLKAKLEAIIELRKTDPAAAKVQMTELRKLRKQFHDEEKAKLMALVEKNKTA